MQGKPTTIEEALQEIDRAILDERRIKSLVDPVLENDLIHHRGGWEAKKYAWGIRDGLELAKKIIRGESV